jgi:sulfatase modifying factor 1
VLVVAILAAAVVLSAAGDSACAKHPSGSSSKDDDTMAKRSSRGRSVTGAVLESVGSEHASESYVTAASRASRFVCPSEMAMIDRAFCIDVYEAALIAVLPDGSERPWPYYEVVPHTRAAGMTFRAVSEPNVFPQGYISGVDASAACKQSGKRLCKPDEWRNACMGPKRTKFPYGNRRERGVCNDNGRSSLRFFNPQLDDKPEHRWMWGYAGNMTDPRLNQLDGTLTRTGERSECTNEYGVYDMVGNLHEWVDDPDGTFQGGYYLDTHINGDGCYYRTTAHPMSHLDYSTGFRCCADVESP